MFREKITEHAEWVEQTLEEHPDIANIEERTKGSLIDPLLRCLGYDPNDPGQVKREAGIRNKRVDYMLIGKQGAKIAVEAKSAKTILSNKVIDQLNDYFHHSDAVAGVLTNGIEYWLFTDLDKTNVMDSEPYCEVNVRNLTANDIHHLEALARNQVNQTAIHEQAQRERYRTLVNEIVDQELGSPSQEFLRLIGKKAGINPLRKAHLKLLAPLVKKPSGATAIHPLHHHVQTLAPLDPTTPGPPYIQAIALAIPVLNPRSKGRHCWEGPSLPRTTHTCCAWWWLFCKASIVAILPNGSAKNRFSRKRGHGNISVRRRRTLILNTQRIGVKLANTLLLSA